MDHAKECAAIIPCLNEDRNIAHIVSSVLRFLPAVYVVDDGSSDETAQAAERAGARVLRHSARRGKGAALLTGCEAALKDGFSYGLTLDGDGQHSPEDIPGFLECLDRRPSALIIGNRMERPDGMPLQRRFVNWWMSRRLSKLCRQHLPDTQCGFRLMDLRTFCSMGLSTTRFELESEVLLSFARAGHRIQFVPVRVIYRDERSKINPLKDTWRWFRWFRAARQSNAGGARTRRC